ncbi:DUF1648 domain-containing protein [Georgenia alba]|uniref:DUF1648 domain-containing protein n=1 Tax=Georgenia alba TaxID=2233858 RepID=A0ABW2QB73_9MICO
MTRNLSAPTGQPHGRAPHRGRAWLLGVALPVLVTGAAWGLTARWIPRLPEEVALHWGADGRVDRLGSVHEMLVTSGVMGGVSLVVLGLCSVLLGRTSFTRRMLLGLAAGSASFFAGLHVTLVAAQLDVTDPAATPVPNGGFTLSVVVAVLAGILAGALAGRDPDRPATGPLPATAPRAHLEDEERAVWLRRVAPSGPFLRWGGVLAAVYLGLSLWFALISGGWFVLVIMGAAATLPMTMLVWEVRVDASGLTARGTLGWPRQHVPAREVVEARTATVSPFREFGGWGLRTAVDGTVGVVIRSGEAIAVERTGGRRLVVTVDDAATGAALLNTFAERSRARPDTA